MGDLTGKIGVEELIAYSDDLVVCLKSERDINCLAQYLEQSKAVQSYCDADYNGVRNLLQDYQKKIDLSKQKADAAKSEAVADAEMDLLQKELDEELQREHLLREELRVITNEIGDLEHQRVSVEERSQLLKKLKQEEQRTQMKLSMYASVSSIIPNLDDHSKISGHIVQRDNKKVVEMFEFDPLKATVFDNCNSIWKMSESVEGENVKWMSRSSGFVHSETAAENVGLNPDNSGHIASVLGADSGVHSSALGLENVAKGMGPGNTNVSTSSNSNQGLDANLTGDAVSTVGFKTCRDMGLRILFGKRKKVLHDCSENDSKEKERAD